PSRAPASRRGPGRCAIRSRAGTAVAQEAGAADNMAGTAGCDRLPGPGPRATRRLPRRPVGCEGGAADERESSGRTLSLDLGPDALPGGGAAVRRRDDRVGHHVQALWHLEHRHRAVYELALPAVGDQALLVAARGSARHPPPLDLDPAAPDRR